MASNEYHIGFSNYYAGVSIQDNPYEFNSNKWHEWRIGWLKAEKEDADNRDKKRKK